MQAEREGSEENDFQRSGLSKKMNTVPFTEIKNQESCINWKRREQQGFSD